MKTQNDKHFGMFVKLFTNPSLYLMAKNAGMDFIFFDCEHGMISTERLHDLMLFGNNVGVPSFVRVGELSKMEVSQALDSGARGVMVPMIETKEEAQKLVNWSKYLPIGIRSYSSGANTNYGPSGGHEENMRHMNEETVTIVQIESKLGVENIEEILSVEGIDAVIVGPVDLSISLGNTGNIMHPQEIAAIEKVIAECKKCDIRFGIIGSNEILEHFKDEINYFVSAIDFNIIRDGIKSSVDKYKEIVG